MKVRYMVAAALLFFSMNAMADATESRNEAKRRISPVNTVMDVNGSMKCKGAQAGATYKVTWTMMGYDTNYTTRLVVFDCTDYYAGFQCGNSYSAAQSLGTIVHEEDVTPEDIRVSAWGYTNSGSGDPTRVQAYDLDFSSTFVMPATRPNGQPWGTAADNNSTPVVYRWYQKATGEAAGVPFISTLLGSKAGYHYGTEARRIESNVSTDVDEHFVCPQ